MSYCCSQCSFTAQFESALMMHKQLHHEKSTDWDFKPGICNTKSNTVPRDICVESTPAYKANKNFKLGGRTSSATRLFDKLRSKICRSKTLFSHPEESADRCRIYNVGDINGAKYLDITGQSECTSKAMKSLECSVSGVMESFKDNTFSCHLCSFDADRITVLDRHLLNDHKIGLENLLKLVMAKTKDGLNNDNTAHIYGIRQPYYKTQDEIIVDGEFILETVTPKIKILKNASSNTDLLWTDIPNVSTSYFGITKEIEKVMNTPDNDALFAKMETLNECMSKFVDSSNNLKKVLTKEFNQKSSVNKSKDGEYFNLGLGDQETPRDWERAHSEKLERHRSKGVDNRSEKKKFSSDSFYF